MNYLVAKSELLNRQPMISFKLMAVEAAAMVGIASVLVQLFA